MRAAPVLVLVDLRRAARLLNAQVMQRHPVERRDKTKIDEMRLNALVCRSSADVIAPLLDLARQAVRNARIGTRLLKLVARVWFIFGSLDDHRFSSQYSIRKPKPLACHLFSK